MPRYRLFHSPGACSLAPHIVLEELGVPYEPVRVVIADGANRKPEYLSVNPRGRVPALAIADEQGERVLTEATAIMVYLARRHPEPGLLPTEPEAFVRALEWMSWLASTMHQAGVRTVFRPERFTTDAAGAEAIATQGRASIRLGYADIEARVTGKSFALGDAFGVVDAYLLVFYRWGNRCGLAMRTEFPEYARMMDGVRARPAVRRVVEREGIQID
ncbi:MAG: glutathione S-transferase family protein [Panacagrimonas sp.]